jgi:hypothetical protein
MGKRIMLAIVGAGIGSLAGVVAAFLGAGNIALIAGGAILRESDRAELACTRITSPRVCQV